MRPLISVNHFFSLIFLAFKLPESLWNRFTSILLDQEMNLEKKIIEKYLFFLVENQFWKKFRFFLKIFSISFRDFEISLITRYFFWNFSEIFFSDKNFRIFFFAEPILKILDVLKSLCCLLYRKLDAEPKKMVNLQTVQVRKSLPPLRHVSQ